jgi:hypothetical protein
MILDGDFDLPQDLLTGTADGGAQCCKCIAGVEVKYAEKIFVCKLLVRVQTAPGEQHIGGADHGGVSEGHPDVEVIIPFQERIVKAVEDAILMVVPIRIHQLGSNAL